jgi:hypothetical protein
MLMFCFCSVAAGAIVVVFNDELSMVGSKGSIEVVDDVVTIEVVGAVTIDVVDVLVMAEVVGIDVTVVVAIDVV